MRPLVREASVQDLHARLGTVSLIDVREGLEFGGGHVEGALNAPLSRLAPDALPDGELWLICRSGARSASAGQRLQAAGRDVVNVRGGMMAWRAAGLPVVGGKPWIRLLPPLVGSLTLGLAPFVPEPHLVGKLRWVAGGAEGMAAMDWFDVAMHGAPWLWLAWTVVTVFRPRTGAQDQPRR